MHLITAKARLSPNVTRLDVQAPRIAEIRPEDQVSFTPPPEEAKHRLVVTRSQSRRLPPESSPAGP